MYTLSSILSFLGVIPDLVILVISFMYLNKTRSNDSVLLFIGSLIHIITRILYAVVPYLTVINSDSDVTTIQSYYMIPSALSFVGWALFCVGFVILIQRVTGRLKEA